MKIEYKYVTVLIIIIAIFCALPLENNASQLSIVGSSSVQPVCEQLAEEYLKTRKDVDINVQGGGSSLGIKCANLSVADVGMSSKEIKCKNLTEYEIGHEGMVLIVNKNNPVDSLSSKQLKDIYSGEIKNWNEVSNRSGKIHTLVREEGSGTLDSFKNVIMKNKEIRNDSIVQNSAGSIKQAVIQDENAIGFVSLIHLDSSLKNVSIDGISASKSSILDGSYKLQRPFILLTNNNPNNQTKDFIKWVMSDESQEILDNEKIFRRDLND